MRRLLVLILISVFCVSFAHANNLLVNGDLEEGIDVEPDGWWVWSTEAGAQYSWETNGGPEGDAHSGNKFVRLWGGRQDEWPWPTIQLGQELIPVDPNTAYYASIWAKDSSDENVGVFDIMVRWYSDEITQTGESNLFLEAWTSDQWEQFTWGPVSPLDTDPNHSTGTQGLISPPDAVYVQIAFDNWNGIWGNNGGIYGDQHAGVLFDDIYFSTEPLRCDFELEGDVNGDCRFDMLDFVIMASNWKIDCQAYPDNPACVPKQD